jgi:hypothetical protein
MTTVLAALGSKLLGDAVVSRLLAYYFFNPFSIVIRDYILPSSFFRSVRSLDAAAVGNFEVSVGFASV